MRAHAWAAWSRWVARGRIAECTGRCKACAEEAGGRGRSGQRRCRARSCGSHGGADAPTKEEPHSLLSEDLTVLGRRSPKLDAMSEYAPLTQSVQVTLEGIEGTEPPSTTFVTSDSRFVSESVPV